MGIVWLFLACRFLCFEGWKNTSIYRRKKRLALDTLSQSLSTLFLNPNCLEQLQINIQHILHPHNYKLKYSISLNWNNYYKFDIQCIWQKCNETRQTISKQIFINSSHISPINVLLSEKNKVCSNIIICFEKVVMGFKKLIMGFVK